MLHSDALLIGRQKTDIDTPALLLDMDAVESNVIRMAELFRDRPCELRPHIKTHKLPLIAHLQVQAGAIGITCAKLSEAMIFIEHGLTDILIANQIVGSIKIRRLAALARYANLAVAVDDSRNAVDLSRSARNAGTQIGVLVEVDVGLKRCGVPPGEPALELARKILSLDGLHFKGLMGYEGGIFVADPAEKAKRCRKANQQLVNTRDLLVKAGVEVEAVSSGGSNTHLLTGFYPGITEIQVGSYVTMDLHNEKFGLDFRQALRVMTTVISRPQPERAVIDAGLKALSVDTGLPGCALPGVTVTALNEEHGHLFLEGPKKPLSPGDKIELIPSHGCTTIPLHTRYVLLRNGVVELIVPIAARGALN